MIFGTGHLTRAVSADQMRALEAHAMEQEGVPGFALMQRAAYGVIAAMQSWRPELATDKTWRPVILCGPGNNGGDGFVIACLLAAMGWQPSVFSEPGLVRKGDAARAEALWRDMAGASAILGFDALADHLGPDSVLFDALFGTGLMRPLTGAWRGALDQAQTVPVSSRIAVDLASGFETDSGRWLAKGEGDRAPLRYGLTVSFHAAKTGHFLAELGAASDALAVMDIGLGTDEVGTKLAGPDAALLKKAHQHKYDHGHAVILGGPPGKGGAARLAARAALRIGAGLVTLACTPAAMMENATRLDAVMLHRLEDAEALGNWLAEDARLNALALGPGLGIGDRTRELVRTVLTSRRAVVLDADALTSFADAPTALFDMLHPNAVLTPHGGEFSRLFPDLAQEARQGNRLTATQAAAERAGAVVLLKGADTVIAAPDGEACLVPALYDRACPWLATAGAGDVLTGMIAGALARGLAPMAAATSAAWLHQEAARHAGPGMIAEDLPAAIAPALAALQPVA